MRNKAGNPTDSILHLGQPEAILKNEEAIVLKVDMAAVPVTMPTSIMTFSNVICPSV